MLSLTHPSAAGMSETLLWGTLALGGGWWWLKQQRQPALDLPAPMAPVDRTSVQAALDQTQALLEQLAQEMATTEAPQAEAALAPLQATWTAIATELDRTNLRVAILGNASVGKTTLVEQLTTLWATQAPSSVAVVDTAANVPITDVATADLIVFVTTGDLTDSELQRIEALTQRQQPVVVAFNKRDQYLPDEQPLVLQQIRERVLGKLPVQNVVAIATAPGAVKVRQHQPDGSVTERLEQPAADITALIERLAGQVAESGQQLILTTVQRQVVDLKAQIQEQLNRVRRDRALPLIEQSQWIAAASAFATPLPSLDLLATAAINTQLVMDLGRLYQQPLSLDQAKTMATALAELMVKLGLVELSTQAIAPLLKSHALTFVAGGLLQGISAAYLTRLAGLTLVQYFEEQSWMDTSAKPASLATDRLSHMLKAVFRMNQRTTFVQTLVNQGVNRLLPKSPAPVAAVEVANPS